MRSVWWTAAVLAVAGASLLWAQDNPWSKPSAPAPEVLTDSSPGIEPGQLIYKENPEYPSKTQKAGVEGAVVLEALIDNKGRVKDVRFVSGDPALADSAAKAVRRWRYTPYKFQGKPVEVHTHFALNFSLHRGRTDCPGGNGALYSSIGKDANSSSANPVTTAEASRTYRAKDGVKPPIAVYTPDPEYTEETREARVTGTVILWAIVTPEGRVATVAVARSLDYALDSQAIDAVCTWKFKPATEDDKPVAVQINVEVSFRL